jgi:hypothetical protein
MTATSITATRPHPRQDIRRCPRDRQIVEDTIVALLREAGAPLRLGAIVKQLPWRIHDMTLVKALARLIDGGRVHRHGARNHTRYSVEAPAPEPEPQSGDRLLYTTVLNEEMQSVLLSVLVDATVDDPSDIELRRLHNTIKAAKRTVLRKREPASCVGADEENDR